MEKNSITLNTKIQSLIDLAKFEPSLKFDIRYATSVNFVSKQVYPTARAFMQKPAAESLVACHRALREWGLGLLIFDAYRPWTVTKIFWDTVPENKRQFVANPASGSVHNRGGAVDLGLYELKSGKPVEMPSDFDELTERSYVSYNEGNPQALKNRNLLIEQMKRFDFNVYTYEWWHFNHSTYKNYDLMDLSFEEIDRQLKQNEAKL